jgi:hypothetical protein
VRVGQETTYTSSGNHNFLPRLSTDPTEIALLFKNKSFLKKHNKRWSPSQRKKRFHLFSTITKEFGNQKFLIFVEVVDGLGWSDDDMT